MHALELEVAWGSKWPRVRVHRINRAGRCLRASQAERDAEACDRNLTFALTADDTALGFYSPRARP